jgi:hypothetical protein
MEETRDPDLIGVITSEPSHFVWLRPQANPPTHLNSITSPCIRWRRRNDAKSIALSFFGHSFLRPSCHPQPAILFRQRQQSSSSSGRRNSLRKIKRGDPREKVNMEDLAGWAHDSLELGPPHQKRSFWPGENNAWTRSTKRARRSTVLGCTVGAGPLLG